MKQQTFIEKFITDQGLVANFNRFNYKRLSNVIKRTIDYYKEYPYCLRWILEDKRHGEIVKVQIFSTPNGYNEDSLVKEWSIEEFCKEVGYTRR